jgi:hypothetical protein
MNEKIRDFFRNNLGYFIVGFASVVYILTAFLTIDQTGKSPAQIIANGAIAFFLGLFINRIFDLQGMMSGDREERVQATKEEHGAIVLRISPHIDKLDDWCEEENKRNYKIQRTKILARVGLKYDDCFDEDGVAKNWTPNEASLQVKGLKRIEQRKVRGFLKAVNLKLTPLSAGELTSEGGKQQDPFYFGRTKAQYEAQHSLGDIISKFGTAIIFGYYGVSLIENFDYARLIWTTLQVALFLVMGVIKMYQAYNFVVDEFRGRIVKKIDNLQKFDNYIKSLPPPSVEPVIPTETEEEKPTEVNEDE